MGALEQEETHLLRAPLQNSKGWRLGRGEKVVGTQRQEGEAEIRVAKEEGAGQEQVNHTQPPRILSFSIFLFHLILLHHTVSPIT